MVEIERNKALNGSSVLTKINNEQISTRFLYIQFLGI